MNSDIFDAIKNNDIDIIEKIFDNSDFDINIQDNYDSTPLMHAIVHEQPEIAKLIIEKFHDVLDMNIQNIQKCTSLMYTLIYEQPEIAKLIIEKFHNVLDMNIQNKYKNTTLMMAIYYKQQEIAKLIIEKCYNQLDINISGKTNCTALMLAIIYEQSDIAKLIIEKFYDVLDINIQDNENKDTALMYAIIMEQPEIIKLIVDKFHDTLNINLRNIDKNTVLYLAKIFGMNDIVEILENWNEYNKLKESKNLKENKMDRQRIRRQRRDYGKYINESIKYRNRQDLDEKGLLFRHKPVTFENYGEDALIVAVNKNDVKAVQNLVQDNRIDINYDGKTLENNHNRNALTWAGYKDNGQIVDILLQQSNIDVNKPDIHGINPLIMASMHDHVNIMQKLINKGATINYVDNENWSSLMWASASNAKEAVKLLLKQPGIDKNIQSKENKTALDYAKQYWNIGIVKLLKQN